MIGSVVIRAFGDELRKIAAALGPSVPGMATSGVSVPSALGGLRNGGVRPPTVPKVGITTPKVR